MARARSIDVVVAGAGITGLAAAHRLARAGRSVLVLEAAGRVGGTIESVAREGHLFETGPAFFSGDSPRGRALVDELGLGGDVVEASEAARRRLVWTGSRLAEVPANPLDLLTTPLLSAGAKFRLLREPWASGPPAEEESAAAFARRRLGFEVARLALTPVVAGMWAGDPERLSAQHAFPDLWALEQRHGSLLRGLRAESGGGSRSSPWSLRRGLESLPLALAERLDVRLGCACRTIRPSGARWRVESEEGEWLAAHVVLACPAEAAGRILSAMTARRSEALAEIPYAPMAVVGLAIPRSALGGDLAATGFLAPRDAGLRLLGCLFLSALFPGREPEGRSTLLAVLGGATDPAVTRWSASRLVEAAVDDLKTALDLRGAPEASVVRKLPRALPQYEVGHGRFLRLAEELERELPGVVLAGSYRGGISLGDCLTRADSAAQQVLAAVGNAASRQRPPKM